MQVLISVILFLWVENKIAFGFSESSIIKPINPNDEELYRVPIIGEIQDTSMILTSKNSIHTDDKMQYFSNKPPLLRKTNGLDVIAMAIADKNTTKLKVLDDASFESFTRPSNTPKIDDQVNETVTENPTEQIANTLLNVVLNSSNVLSNIPNNTAPDKIKAKNPASIKIVKGVQSWFIRTKLKIKNFFIRIMAYLHSFFD
ncbi:hypothetical protein PV325_007571 [Microctonus aethiopoides]|nr:hypothetical protein PV325_007571 [Microctonus aethiopoides]